MTKPTRTTNPLHFEDLDPKRFEDLSFQMVYRLATRWDAFNHYGAAGDDDGIDIHAVETLDDGQKRTWHIQCKRYQKINASDLKSIVDKILKAEKVPPDVLLVTLACNPSKKAIEAFTQYANSKG